MDNPTNETGTAWMKLFHASGADVRIPLRFPAPAILVAEFKQLNDTITNALTAGFLVNPPGLDESETIEEVDSVVVRSIQNREGHSIPALDLYSTNQQFGYKFLTVYLDNQEMEKEFETISGLRLSQVIVYDGAGSLERGKRADFAKYFTRPTRNLQVSHKPNPGYDPDEKDISKKKAARRFFRWPGLVKDPTSASNQGAQVERVSITEAAEIVALLNTVGGKAHTLCAHFRVAAIQDLPRSEYGRITSQLKAKVAEIEAANRQRNQQSTEIPF